jgi:hypothetical protein
MSSDLAEIAPEGLSDLLARIVAKQEIRDGIAAQLKSVEKELESLESLASEQLGASGLDGCRVAGKTWWIDEALYVSAPKENREKIIEAAEGEGLQDAVSVNTATIKSWLSERAKRLDTSLDDAAVGTKFEGLISQFVKVRLRSRATG